MGNVERGNERTEFWRLTMKKFWMMIAIGSLVAVGGLAETLSGTISDTKCGAKHEAAGEKDAVCVKRCLEGGAKAVFVSGGKVYAIVADSQEKAKASAGQKVTVNGKVDGATITIESMEAAEWVGSWGGGCWKT